MPTFCKGATYAYDCINVREVGLPSGPSYKETKDHSKWSISTSSTAAIICVGDINRQYSQATRGGGTVSKTNFPCNFKACMKNAAVWAQFKSLILEADSC